MSSGILTLALLAQSAPAADESAQHPPAPEIVVEGSRISRPAATIVSASPPDTALPATALDLLEDLPDVRAVSTGGAGGGSFVSIRSAEPNFALVLLDGVNVTNPSSSAGGGFDFAQLDPALIESVAIVPTSRSAVHGSDALSGVISIRLPLPGTAGVSGSASATADSADGYSVAGRIGAGWGGGGAFVAASQFDSGNLTEGSSLERRQLLGKAYYAIGGWNLSGFALYGETGRAGFPESSGGPRFARNRALETRDTRFFAGGVTLAGPDAAAIRPSLRIGYYGDNVRAHTPAIFPGVFAAVPALASDTDFNRLEIVADTRVRVSETFDLVAGGGYRREAADSTGTIDLGFARLPTAFAIARKQVSAFAEGEWRPVKGLKLSAAVRHDRTDSKGKTTKQASVEYASPGSGVTLFGGYAEGFHLPSLFALAFPLTANPNLRPERSTSWEGGLRWKSGATQMRVGVFATHYVDLIDFDPVLFTTVNRSSTRSRGVSLSGDGRVGRTIEWNGSFTWIHIDSDVPLRGRPTWYGNARIAWRPVDAVRLGAAAGFNSNFLETSVPTGVVRLDGHAALDLFADWRVAKPFTLSVALRNVTDAAWQDAVGFPVPGRLLRMRAALAF